MQPARFVEAARAAGVDVTGKSFENNLGQLLGVKRDLRERVVGSPQISTDGFHPYKQAIRDAVAGLPILALS